MGLFGLGKKKKISKDKKELDIPIPKYESEKKSDEELKKVINAEKPKKTSFNLDKTSEEKEYLDEIMNENLNLNSKEVNNALKPSKIKKGLEEKKVKVPEIQASPKEEIKLPEMPIHPDKEEGIHPKIKNKLDKHHEVIHIDTDEKNEYKPKDIINSVAKKEFVNNIKSKKIDLLSQPAKEIQSHKSKLEVEPPKRNTNHKLPNFDNELSEIQKTKKMVQEFKKKKIVKENVFVKSQLYREVLHSNIIIKEKIKNCNSVLDATTKSIHAQSTKGEKLRQELEKVQDGLLTIEDKLFDSNPLTR